MAKFHWNAVLWARWTSLQANKVIKKKKPEVCYIDVINFWFYLHVHTNPMCFGSVDLLRFVLDFYPYGVRYYEDMVLLSQGLFSTNSERSYNYTSSLKNWGVTSGFFKALRMSKFITQ